MTIVDDRRQTALLTSSVATSLRAGLFLAVGLWATSDHVSVADEPRSGESAPLSAILFAPSRPVFLELVVEVDDDGLQAFRQQFAARWFSEFDADGDGLLNKTEADKTLAPTDAQAGPPLKVSLESVDTDPADKQISLPEFEKYADKRLGPSFLALKKKQADDEAAGLFEQLDTNDDGYLTLGELQNSQQALARHDANDDETIGAAEVKSAADAATPADNNPNGIGGLPVVVLDRSTNRELLAERLLHEYDRASTGEPDGHLDHAELQVEVDAIAPFDGDGSQKLDSSELARLVREIPAQIRLHVKLFDGSRGRPTVTATPRGTQIGVELSQSSAGAVALTVDQFNITFRAKRTRASRGDNSRFFAVRFGTVDKDKNGYLDSKEFEKLGLPDANFAGVDADGNEQVVIDEIVVHLSKAKATPINQVLMRVSDESRPLFDVLDARADRRLSPRELNAAPDRLKELDGDKDGRVSTAELLTDVAVELSVKRPSTRNPAMRVPRTPNRRSAVISREGGGPDWFLRMDRNYDGDVSWREFLGSRPVFDRLDADRDGLISGNESKSATKK